MTVARSIASVRRQVAAWRARGLRVGLVPTMGALHEGHLSLVRRCRRLCDRTVVSIFVNPTQFGPREDFSSYPRTWKSDLRVCRRAGVDLIFAPSVETMYPEGFATMIRVGPIGDLWEGAARPGHFEGVATVVAKLFYIIGPDVAIFGQKDYQQTVVIRRMVTDLNLPVRLVVAPTVREPGGLAMSSRNAYLDALSRQDARSIHRSLLWAGREIRAGRRNVARLTRVMTGMIEAGGRFDVDQIGFCDPATLASKKTAVPPLVILVAARCRVKGPALGRRYIDNLLIR
ncbi:MAG TPA: pantoate--beta-alanine ligase [bacterium]|nr:pantoate--beta-alanine ligase [bacterium]